MRRSIFVLSFTAAHMAAAPEEQRGAIDFSRDVEAILASNCQVCHGAKTQMGGLRLDNRAGALKGGTSGKPAVIPGNSSASLLVRYVAGLDPKITMPPTGQRLSPSTIAVLRRWIDEGAVWPEKESAGQEKLKTHRAFRPLTNPSVPKVKDAAWPRNPIDHFVLSKIEGSGWKPGAPAAPRALLRRFYLDLNGLPPSVWEQEEFLKAPSADAFDRLIDDLLARPAYGERWGRYWLDLVRYGETNGYERDSEKLYVWRYRDYVIRAFNSGKPYNRFVVEQIAGDQLPDADAETLIATGFNRLGPWDAEPADRAQDRFEQLDDIVRTTSEVFLGVTLGCARCHDHKFDPLTARDYYGMVAVFNGLRRPMMTIRTEVGMPVGTREELARQAARDKRIAPIEARIEDLIAPFRRQFLQSGKSKLPELAVEAYLTEPARRTEIQSIMAEGNLDKLNREIDTALPPDLRQERTRLEEKILAIRRAEPDLPRGYFMDEPEPHPPATRVLVRGYASQPGEEVGPSVPASLAAEQPDLDGGGANVRRLAFARWLVSPENPLTARVIVNRVWQLHFGEGLVRTPSDFGVLGDKPVHPELLDWLAGWFIREGWSLKKLHRLIMTSNTYRMSRQSNPKYAEEDPENRLLWRAGYRRLDAEAIRDSILAVSGRLNGKMYGPSMFPPVHQEVINASGRTAKSWKTSDDEEVSRRTIYAHSKRSMIIPMLETLDFCDTTRSAAFRQVTTVAPQALTLLNGDFVNRQSRHFAGRLLNDVGPDAERQIDRAYRLALARPPTPSEKTALLAFLEQERERLVRESQDAPEALGQENAARKALEQLCRVIFNLNEFVYLD